MHWGKWTWIAAGTVPVLAVPAGFPEAFATGREAMDQGRWRDAIAALERAVQLHPVPAGRIPLRDRQPLTSYYPYSFLARCHLELGETSAARALLHLAEVRGEPVSEREAVARRLPPVEIPAPSPAAPAAGVPAGSRRQPPLLPLPFWLGAGALGTALAGLAWWRCRRLRQDRSPRTQGAVRHPATLGPYHILRPLGHGAFATTYLARHRDTEQEVALKVPHPHIAQDPEFRRRFSQEARLGALLGHPRLAAVLDPGNGSEPGWIAMEYVAGPTLEAWLQERGRLPLREAVAIALGIAEAMAYAHARGVVHRDLKPANIILGAQGPKVMDLGIARELDRPGRTTTHGFLGTPLYAAPEAQLHGRAGPAADRYSLGVMLFEMLAGRPPFQGQTPFAILDQHSRAPMPDLCTLAQVPPDLARLAERLLEKEPEQRPEDGELVARLEQWHRALGQGREAGAL